MASRALGPAEGSKSSNGSSQQDATPQPKMSEQRVRDGPSSIMENGMRPNPSEQQSKKVAQLAGLSANAANTAARNAARPNADPQPATTATQKTETPATATRPAPPADAEVEGTAVPNVDGKETPRHHEVRCMFATLISIVAPEILSNIFAVFFQHGFAYGPDH